MPTPTPSQTRTPSLPTTASPFSISPAAPPSPVSTKPASSPPFPGTNPTKGWETEESLDVQWAHAIAPMANIILVQCTPPPTPTSTPASIRARTSSPACVVSMSWSGDESSTDPANNSHFTTPSSRTAASPSSPPPGTPALLQPFPQHRLQERARTPISADSPNVVAVGGTSLYQNSGTYSSESGWGNGTSSQTAGGGGGGISTVESDPSYGGNCQCVLHHQSHHP